MIECQYEQEPFDDKDVLCEPNGDDEEDLYGDDGGGGSGGGGLANKDIKDSVIYDKSSGDIIEDYFGMI